MIDYKQLSPAEAQQVLSELGDVLQACVTDGASVGFTDPQDRAAIDSFWQDRILSLASNDCDLLVAFINQRVAATVMINYSPMPNGLHRAEISKLLVDPKSRRQGIARQLMILAEQQAADKGRTLLVLDTRSGDVASQLYLAMGWKTAGEIPNFAISTTGDIDATTLMYKINQSS